jgi:glutamate synthase (NADPH/NADH) small chain
MANMQKNKNPMPRRTRKSAAELSGGRAGYTDEMARQEAERCLGCKNKPCSTAAPWG